MIEELYKIYYHTRYALISALARRDEEKYTTHAMYFQNNTNRETQNIQRYLVLEYMKII